MSNRSISNRIRGRVVSPTVFVLLFAGAAQLAAVESLAQKHVDPAQRTASEASLIPGVANFQTAETILANQPAELVEHLMRDRVLVLQEVHKDGAVRGGHRYYSLRSSSKSAYER